MKHEQFNNVEIALNKLVMHPDNVRLKNEAAYSPEEITPLAANILEHGLLNPLIIQKLEDGPYGVVGGGRRLSALNMPAEDKLAKSFKKTMMVHCREISMDVAVVGVSFSENALQLPMDALDRFETFVGMIEQDGASVADVARTFAITERQVNESLRLGKIHPDIRAAHRTGDLNLAALKAFAAHPDPDVQLTTYNGLVEEYGHVNQWRARDAIQNRFERAGGAIGAFILSAETRAFPEGEKDILIFSDAEGTGRSYHAAPGMGNTHRRRHYFLEPGWRADAAIQGLGRTHRSGQLSAPFFRVCTSDVHGEKRFTSTIARRLDTLGALTKGQRETASQGMFRASDNLESPIARACLRNLYGDILRGECPAMSYGVFCDWTALRLADAEGNMLDALPPIQRFLNRVLALPINLQNALFEAFMEKIEIATERARAAGTLDLGLEVLRGDKILSSEAEILRVCPETGAETRLVPVTVQNSGTYPTSAEVLDTHANLVPMQNISSGSVALVSARPIQVFERDGALCFERRILRPAKKSFIDEAKFKRSQWEHTSPEHFRQLWDEEVASLPATTTTEVHLLTGRILPIWRDIPGANTKIYRTQPENGPALLGRALNAQEASMLRGKFLKADLSKPEDILKAVTLAGRSIEIAQGLTLSCRRVAGKYRLEITGADRDTLRYLKSLGCFSEIHQYQLRLFLPWEEGQEDNALNILNQISEGRAVVQIAAE